MRKLLLVIASIILSIGLYAQNMNVIEDELQRFMDQKGDELISINIVFKSQIDNNKLNVRHNSLEDKSIVKEQVINELKTFSSNNQKDVMSILQSEVTSNKVMDVESHWLANMISCKATNEVIYRLSKHPDILVIGHNKKEKLIDDEQAMEVDQPRGMVENISKVNANGVWAEGYTGKGVVVAVLDSGVNTEHVDLADHLWDGGSSYPDHGWNFVEDNSNTHDYNGHGTHCAGTICGDGTSGTQTGMAPDATLMCIKVLNDEGEGTFEDFVSGIEFAISNGADVMSISLGWAYPTSSVSIAMREVFENVLSAGVVASVAAGNDRDLISDYPIPRNINSPGNCPPPWLNPDQEANAGGLSAVVCVGAVDYNDTPAYFTSEGPVTWQGTDWDDYKLDMTNNIEDGWLYYDDGINTEGIGGPESFYWGVMFPTNILQEHIGSYITKVSMFDYAQSSGDINIYYGGTSAPGTLVHTQSYSVSGTKTFVEFNLNSALPIDGTENIWITFSTNQGENYPAAACNDTGNPNSRWLSIDGIAWDDLINSNLYDSWMIRAFASDNAKDEVSELKPIKDYEYTSSTGEFIASGRHSNKSDDNNLFGLIRPDVSAPGVGIVSTSNTNNYGFKTMSGTSMATPCVAGVMALLLDKNPNLSPADICRLLETTATPLEYIKSNLTGSGRINALIATEEINEEEAIEPCELSFVMTDQYGDGWNGGYIEIVGALNGNVYKVELTGGSNGNRNIEITSDIYTFTWISGEWEYEVGFEILYNDEVIYSLPEGTIGDSFNPVFLENYEINCDSEEDDDNYGDIEVLIEEDFESYTIGNKLAQSAIEVGIDWWTTWSNKPGGSEDGLIVDLDGNKCAYLSYGNDQVLLLGDEQSGVYDLEFDIMVPNGSSGYFNILHDFSSWESTWAMQAYLHMTNDGDNSTYAPGHGIVHAGSNSTADVAAIYDEWMHFRLHVDTDADLAQYYYTTPGNEEILVCEWQWSLDSFGKSVVGRALDAMNFFPPESGSEYYLDNFKFIRIGNETKTELVFNPEEINLTLGTDNTATVDINIDNVGTSIGEYTAWVDYGVGQGGSNKEMVTYAMDPISDPTGLNWTANEAVNFEIAALYPATSYSNSVMGTYITSAAYAFFEWVDSNGLIKDILEPGTDVTFRVYGQGSNGIPGEILAEKTISQNQIVLNNYTVVEFDEPVALTGYDVYVAVEMTAAVNGTAMNLDNSGQAIVGYGDLYRQNNGAFQSITTSNNYGNWCLYMICEGTPIAGSFATLNKTYGSLPIGSSDNITLNVNSFGLDLGQHNATIKFVTNDPAQPEVEIPLALNVSENGSVSPTHRNVLIETFTGRNEGYSPDGHRIANEIAAANHSKVFPINIHCGGFSPTTYPNLNTADGETIMNGFNVTYFPSGNVNRNSSSAIDRNQWNTNTNSQLSQNAEVNISGNVEIDETSRTATITVDLDYTSSSAYNTNYLTIMMLQDSIWGSQSGGNTNPEQYVNGQYCHMHVLRDVITSTWGDAVSPTSSGSHISKTYTYTIPESIGNPNGVEVDLDNIYFLAFVTERYQGTPTRPILNVARLNMEIDTQEPENFWTPDPTLYANNMTVIANVNIDGIDQANTNLELGAFCGNEVRGSIRPQFVPNPVNRYEYFLMIYGNSNDNITFKLYDHESQSVVDLDCQNSIAFEVNGTVGNMLDPYNIIFTSDITQSTALTSGWNWYSSYINVEGTEGLELMKEALGTSATQIKNQTAFVDYASIWFGTLTATNLEEMYMIKMNSALNMETTGPEANPTDNPITLGTNWKWIGYPVNGTMSVNEAFSNITPNSGDYVKSQLGFAQYYEGLGWTGTLNTMTPGQGYMYQNTSGTAKTLVYPEANAKSELDANITSENNHWVPNSTKYPTNMTMIATVEGMKDYEVAAFCNGEVRGSARPIYVEQLDSYMLFLTIYGEENDEISFRYFDLNTEEETELIDVMNYGINATIGDVMNPHVLNFATLNIDEMSPNFNIYPNPVEKGSKIYLGTTCEKVEIYNTLGVKISEYENVNSIEGIETSGVYVVKAINNGNVSYSRVIVE